MKSKFNKFLLSTVFAGLCFGCFTPSFAEGERPEAKDPLEAPLPENVGPKLPAPKLDESAPAPAEEGKKFSKIGDVEKEDQNGVGFYFYCSYVGARGAARGAHGNWTLEAALKGACMSCLANGVRSCEFDGCTAKDYYTDKNGDRRFDGKSVEREVAIDDKSANLACPIPMKGSRTDKDTGVSLGEEVGKKQSIASQVPKNPNIVGSSEGGTSYHYESGSSFESNSNGYYREKEFNYDSRRGGASREIVIPPRPRFWGDNGGFFGPPPGFPGAPTPKKGKPEVIPNGKGRPEIDRRNPGPAEGKPQPQNEQREDDKRDERTGPI